MNALLAYGDSALIASVEAGSISLLMRRQR
jgi:hypothetical protein